MSLKDVTVVFNATQSWGDAKSGRVPSRKPALANKPKHGVSKRPKNYKSFDVDKIVHLPTHLQFLVVDERPGRTNYHKAHRVVALGRDSNGDVTHLAFSDDSTSFEPDKNFTTIGFR